MSDFKSDTRHHQVRSKPRATVRRVTADLLPRAHAAPASEPTPTGRRSRETLVLAAAVPFLFLHAHNQPSASLGVGSTSVDVTLADAAVACALVAAGLRSRREGWQPPSGGVVLGLAAAFLLVCAISLATPSLLGEEYDLTRHAISLAKFGWYATLLPATGCSSERPSTSSRSSAPSSPGASPRPRGGAAVPRDRGRVRWEATGSARALLRRLSRLRRAVGRRAGGRLDRDRPRPRKAGGAALVGPRARHGWAGHRPLGSDDRRASASGSRSPRCFPSPAPPPRCAAAAPSRGRVTLLVTAGTATIRADTMSASQSSSGIRERTRGHRESRATRTARCSVHRRPDLRSTAPVTGVGWQASSEQWAYAPFLDDARARFPGEPDQAFPSPEHPWGIQMLYLQVAADLGIAGSSSWSASPPRGRRRAARVRAVTGARSSASAGSGRRRRVDGIGLVAGLPARCADLDRVRAGDRP